MNNDYVVHEAPEYPDHSSLQTRKKKTKIKQESLGAIAYEQKLVKKSEHMKKCLWVNWLNRLEMDWRNFHYSLLEKKENWLREKENDWEVLVKYIESRWNRHDELMNLSYKYYILKISVTWNENQWEEWIRSEAKHLIQIEWENFVYENEYYLDLWIFNNWTQWKDEKIMSWQMQNWKLNEDKYWAKMAKHKWSKSLFSKIKSNLIEWNKRKRTEKKQWEKWVHKKQNFYMNNNEWDIWIQWKEHKMFLLNELKESLVKKWMDEKKWITLIEERPNINLQNNKHVFDNDNNFVRIDSDVS
ncbi:tryptophan-rich antigen [Plasmodium malariae]|uniref:Tryptophan-rich antigen n=1 Tax=Plasmodium malariae TaxID=5858 RepID=A0A1D3JLS3_PLAMA|nr:tryptophan-rich antigen [Plasmodium malariae]SBT87547.1 tryptophan-rich antigen [Plasmodium malariae]